MRIHHAIRHSVDFMLLTLIIGSGLLGVLYFRFDIASQVAIVILMGALYIFWGVMHHHHDGNLTLKVVLEYSAMAVIVSAILIVFLLRT